MGKRTGQREALPRKPRTIRGLLTEIEATGEEIGVGDADYVEYEARFLRGFWQSVAVFDWPDEDELSDILSKLRSKRTAASVGDAIRRIGLDSLRAGRWERPLDPVEQGAELSRSSILEDVRAECWRLIEDWYGEARTSSTPRAREASSRNLQKIGRALAGDQRGRRGRSPDPYLVCCHYYQSVFRLGRAVSLLQKGWGRGELDDRIRRVSSHCGISEDEVRDLLNVNARRERATFDAVSHLAGRSRRIEEVARVVTANKHGITQHRVSNILSESRKKARTA